jgi:DNA topoisomerase-1
MKGEQLTDISCPECKRPLKIKSGKNGLFLGCSGYPDCRYTANFSRDENGNIVLEPKKETGKISGTCEKCGKPMVERVGKYGPFLACTGFPECTNTRPIGAGTGPVSTGVSCPTADCPGSLLERTSKRGRKFYSCNQYPQCRFAMWDEPHEGVCPDCGTPVLAVKRPKDREPYLACRKTGCRFTRPLPPASND